MYLLKNLGRKITKRLAEVNEEAGIDFPRITKSLFGERHKNWLFVVVLGRYKFPNS